MAEKPTPLDLLAYHLYQVDNRANGFVRWWCMDEQLKAKYLDEATRTYENWAQGELEAMTRNDL